MQQRIRGKLEPSTVQGSAKKWAPVVVNFNPAVATSTCPCLWHSRILSFYRTLCPFFQGFRCTTRSPRVIPTGTVCSWTRSWTSSSAAARPPSRTREFLLTYDVGRGWEGWGTLKTESRDTQPVFIEEVVQKCSKFAHVIFDWFPR